MLNNYTELGGFGATRVTPEEAKKIAAEEREQAKSSRERARFARQTFNHGRGDRDLAITRLARAFPGLDHADGVEPFDAVGLAEWAKGGKSHGQICAAQFILSVWNVVESQAESYGLPYFDLHEAFGVWDRHHQQAFVGWAEEPWWP